MPESLLRRPVTLETSLLGFRGRSLNRFAINADPARPAVSLRFLFRPIALKLFLFGLLRGDLHDFSVDTNPAPFLAATACFFPGTETLAASSLAFRGWNENDMAVDTTPAVIRRRITA